jgi:hypothetical protein
MLDGRYRAVAVTIQYGVAKSGTDQVGVGLEITQGPNKGQRSTSILYFSDEAAQYSVKKLRACGFTGDDLGSLILPGSNDPETGIGKPSWKAVEVDISLTTESYVNDQGETKSTQKCNIYDGEGGQMVFQNQMKADEVRGFASRFNKFLGGATPSGNASGGGSIKL